MFLYGIVIVFLLFVIDCLVKENNEVNEAYEDIKLSRNAWRKMYHNVIGRDYKHLPEKGEICQNRLSK